MTLVGVILGSLACAAVGVGVYRVTSARHARKLAELRGVVEALAARKLGDGSVETGSDDCGLGLTKLAAAYDQQLARSKELAGDLASERDCLRVAMSSIAEGVISVDETGDILLLNRQAQVLTGWERIEAIGMPIAEILVLVEPGNDRPLALSHDRLSQWNSELTAQLVTREGERILVEISVAPLRAEAEYTGAVLAFRDIRAQRLAVDRERKLIEQAARHQALTERAGELARGNTALRTAETALKESAQQATSASVAKGQFLANMSHEIRTPINGVLGMLGLLLDTELDDEQRELGSIAHESAAALLGLINDILDFSKIEAGKLDIEVTNFELRPMLEGAASALAVHAQRKGVELTLHIDSDVPDHLTGDPTRLRQIVNNVGSNAVKFTAKGEVVVRVSLQKRQGNQVILRFAMRDTGLGIDPTKIDRLFEPFSQADASTTRRFGGTGLGLGICRQLAELMGGAIGATSKPGEGSEFWFTAALKDDSVALRENAPKPSPRQQVLLVIEHDSVRRMLSGLFAETPYEVVLAKTAVEGKSLLASASQSFAATIIDLQTDSQTGLEFARVLTKAEKAAMGGKRGVLMTTVMRVTGEMLSEVGLTHSLLKPVRQRALLRMLGLAARDSEPTVASTAAASEVGSRPKVLIVDDHPVNRLLLVKMLKKRGYESDAAASGAEALALLRAGDYGMVLMDCQMPEMDGFETTRRIRAEDNSVRDSNIKIVAVTANAMVGDRERCLASGMDDYVSKPVQWDELERVLVLEPSAAAPDESRQVA